MEDSDGRSGSGQSADEEAPRAKEGDSDDCTDEHDDDADFVAVADDADDDGNDEEWSGVEEDGGVAEPVDMRTKGQGVRGGKNEIFWENLRIWGFSRGGFSRGGRVAKRVLTAGKFGGARMGDLGDDDK